MAQVLIVHILVLDSRLPFGIQTTGLLPSTQIHVLPIVFYPHLLLSIILMQLE